MKKIFTLIVLTLSLSSTVTAQVGVNTTNPNTSLDVQASRNSNGVIDNNQFFGIQAPRITRAELTDYTGSYGPDQNGALIYISDISAGNALASSPREFVTSVGYYYFENSSNKWRRLTDNTNTVVASAIKAENGLTATADNIVKLGGTLKETTKITQGTNNFVFQGTNAADNAAFNTYTNVNINTDPNNTTNPALRVAHPINTLNPALLLSGVNNGPELAVGQASLIGFNPNGKSGYWPIGIGAEYINSATGQGSADFFIATSAGGTAAKKFVVTNAGNVGINTTNPASTLDVVNGDANSAAGIIAPRLTLQELISKTILYDSKQTGAILYIKDISGDTSGRTRNITSIGYYYYDGINWQPFSKTSASGSDNWSINGNSNISTTRGTNYLGTSNATDLVLKTNGTEQMTISAAGNVGIGTASPTNKLHIKSTSNPVKIEGLSVNTSSAARPIVVGSDGILKTGSFPQINLVPNDVGTVMAIGGQLIVAQEITVLMTADFAFDVSPSTPPPIGNLTNVIIDNQNTFKASSTTNSFTVNANGTYLLQMNVQIKDASDFPVIGIWCNNLGKWVARVNDEATSVRQTYTLITAIEMYTTNTYSFRVAGASTGTILWSSSGYTGTGPISFYSLKRLK